MKKNREISIRLIEMAYKGIFRPLFSASYLICGNERSAESILMKTMLSNPAPEEKDYEELLETVKEASVKAAKAEDASFFSFSGDLTGNTTPLTEWLLTLDEKKARILVLKYALRLSVKDISQITGENTEKVKSVLQKGKARSFQETKNTKAATMALKNACAQVMNSSCYPPDYAAVIRSIEKILDDKNTEAKRSFSVKPVISWLISGIMMVFIALIIWMSVVLIDYLRDPDSVKIDDYGIQAQEESITEE